MSTKTVIKLNNIPHGFYEKQMKKYFSQFGKVKTVLLVRSRKTHNSRGFGFVEFELPQVARAAAEAMHNYLFFNTVLKCRQMDKDELPRDLLQTKFKGPNGLQKQKMAHNKDKRDLSTMVKHLKNIQKVEKILKGMDIEFSCRIINNPLKTNNVSNQEEICY